MEQLKLPFKIKEESRGEMVNRLLKDESVSVEEFIDAIAAFDMCNEDDWREDR
jgi:hypothetical protein